MSDDDDQFKLAEALAKGTAAGAVSPLTKQVDNLFSQFTKEAGLGLGYVGTYLRLLSLIKFGEMTNKLLEERGIKPQAVPIKLLLPIMESASLEETDDMRMRWASLLASNADPNYKGNLLPGFSDVLRQLSPIDVQILEKLYAPFIEKPEHNNWSKSQIPAQINFIQYSGHDFAVKADNLERLKLVELVPWEDNPYPKYFLLTAFGFSFVSACRPAGEPEKLTTEYRESRTPVTVRNIIPRDNQASLDAANKINRLQREIDGLKRANRSD